MGAAEHVSSVQTKEFVFDMVSTASRRVPWTSDLGGEYIPSNWKLTALH